MAPNKFEEHIKDKLDKRTLQPSTDAWSKLSKRLDTQQEKKNNKPYWWFGLAASIVGVLLVVSQFLNNKTGLDNEIKIVDSPVIKQNSTSKIVAEEEVKVKEFNINKENHEVEIKEFPIKSKTKVIIENNSSVVAVAVSSKKKTNIQENDVTVKPVEILKEKLTFEEQKIQDVVVQVQALKNENKVVTEAYIDALLFEAQKEIRLNKLYNETTGVVDANALLQDVEADLEQSFRNKVFKALKTSYNSVKTAVAQRND